MTTADPDRIRDQIEHTQRDLSTNVDLLTEKVTPSRIVQRRVDRTRRAMTTMRDRVMGSAADTADTTKERVSDMADDAAQSVRETARSAKETVQEAPDAIRRGTEGNPLAAGLIAFGAGWLLSTLVPAGNKEQELAERATRLAREHSDKLGAVAEEVKENLREPAQHAAEAVKSTAADAAQTVRDDTRSAAGDVTDRAQEARHSVQDNRG